VGNVAQTAFCMFVTQILPEKRIISDSFHEEGGTCIIISWKTNRHLFFLSKSHLAQPLSLRKEASSTMFHLTFFLFNVYLCIGQLASTNSEVSVIQVKIATWLSIV